jgi:HlyD family secretion protein
MNKTGTLLTISVIALLAGCDRTGQAGFLSSATVDSDLWKVSPVSSGNLLEVPVREGDSVRAGQLVASVDTVPLVLRLAELQASLSELSSEVASRAAENLELAAADRGIQRELARTRALVADGAATAQHLDDLTTQKETSNARIAAGQAAVAALRSKAALLEAQKRTLRDQIDRCRLVAPAAGLVLTKYRNAGEAAIPGRPVVEIGRTDTLWAEFFVNQTDLARLKLGQPLRLRLDRGKGEAWVPARLSWIAGAAEFTPKGVQTREGRNELVFRVRALAANPDGSLKRGLPVEVWE